MKKGWQKLSLFCIFACMKRIYSFIAASLTVISAASCIRESASDSHQQEVAVVYTAIVEGADTKPDLGTNGSSLFQSLWEDGDIIKIYHGGGISYSFKTSLKKPSPVAEFKYSGYDNVNFTDVSVVLASFPACAARGADPQQESIMMQSEIPALQNLESDVDSHNRNAVPAVAYSADGTLHFQNAAALLKFSLNQDGVSRVRLTARHGEIITGMICIYLDAEHKISDIIPDEYADNAQQTHKSYVELSSEGTFQSRRAYYLSIIPGTLESGFMLEFFDANGIVIYTKDYDSSITVRRNEILDLGSLGGGLEEVNDAIEDMPEIEL